MVFLIQHAYVAMAKHRNHDHDHDEQRHAHEERVHPPLMSGGFDAFLLQVQFTYPISQLLTAFLRLHLLQVLVLLSDEPNLVDLIGLLDTFVGPLEILLGQIDLAVQLIALIRSPCQVGIDMRLLVIAVIQTLVSLHLVPSVAITIAHAGHHILGDGIVMQELPRLAIFIEEGQILFERTQQTGFRLGRLQGLAGIAERRLRIVHAGIAVGDAREHLGIILVGQISGQMVVSLHIMVQCLGILVADKVDIAQRQQTGIDAIIVAAGQSLVAELQGQADSLPRAAFVQEISDFVGRGVEVIAHISVFAGDVAQVLGRRMHLFVTVRLDKIIVERNGVGQTLRLSVAQGKGTRIEGIDHLQTDRIRLQLDHTHEVVVERIFYLVGIMLGRKAQGGTEQEEDRNEDFR